MVTGEGRGQKKQPREEQGEERALWCRNDGRKKLLFPQTVAHALLVYLRSYIKFETEATLNVLSRFLEWIGNKNECREDLWGGEKQPHELCFVDLQHRIP